MEEGALEMEGAIVKEPEEIDPSAPDLQINPQDQRIDVRAKFALQRMLKVPVTEDPDMAKNAARLIRGINSGTLDGIYGDDLGKAVELVQEHSTKRLKLVPKGEDAALVLDKVKPLKGPIPPDKPPTVIFRGDTPDISKEPGRLDIALKEAGQTFELWQQQELRSCDNTGWIVPVTNLVPSSYCMSMGISPGKSACSTLKRPEILDNFDQGKSDLKLSHRRKICIIARCVKDRHGTPDQIDSISLIGQASTEGDSSFNKGSRP